MTLGGEDLMSLEKMIDALKEMKEHKKPIITPAYYIHLLWHHARFAHPALSSHVKIIITEGCAPYWKWVMLMKKGDEEEGSSFKDTKIRYVFDGKMPYDKFKIVYWLYAPCHYWTESLESIEEKTQKAYSNMSKDIDDEHRYFYFDEEDDGLCRITAQNFEVRTLKGYLKMLSHSTDLLSDEDLSQ